MFTHYSSWGAPPKAIVPTVQFFKLVFRRWRAHYVISQLPVEYHPAVQLRCKVFDTFAGNREGWQYGNWNGDYMNDDPNYNLSVNKLRTSGDGIGRIIFAAQGKKYDREKKSTFGQTSRFWSKQELLVKNQNFVRKSTSCSKI